MRSFVPRSGTAWKRSFAHLANGDINFMLAAKAPGFSTSDEWQSLTALSRVGDARVRRALLWRHLARIITRNRDWIHVLRFEDLIVKTHEVLARAITRLDPSRADRDVVVDTAIHGVRPASAIDAVEARLMWDVCGGDVSRYGYVDAG